MRRLLDAEPALHMDVTDARPHAVRERPLNRAPVVGGHQVRSDRSDDGSKREEVPHQLALSNVEAQEVRLEGGREVAGAREVSVRRDDGVPESTAEMVQDL